jgi:hypothetical protein
MRSNAVSARRGIQALALCVILGLTISLGAVGAATGSAGDETAVASKKKKCKPGRDKRGNVTKKGSLRCTPAVYHLSVSGTIGFRFGGGEAWSAEVDLGRRPKLNDPLFELDYMQNSGTFTIHHATELQDSGCNNGADAVIQVPTQTLTLQKDLDNVIVRFDRHFKVEKGTYEVWVGNGSINNPGLTAYGVKHCPDEPPQQVLWGHGSVHFQTTIGRGNGGPEGLLSGSDSYRAPDAVTQSLRWTLSPRRK